MKLESLAAGDRIEVLLRIDRREGQWTATVTGEVVEVLDAPTGSWYAHGKNDKYWLKRIKLRKDDGEISIVSLDDDSRVVLLGNDPSNTIESEPRP